LPYLPAAGCILLLIPAAVEEFLACSATLTAMVLLVLETLLGLLPVG
jgi:hypothetical protein